MKTLKIMLVIIAVAALGLQCNAQGEKEDELYEEVFFQVDTMPLYPGGQDALIKDITNLVKFPEEALEKDITGKVYVVFIVGKDGKINNTIIARGVDPILDKEALQTINQLNKIWKPGIKNGEAVNISITLIFDFKKNKSIEVSVLKQSRNDTNKDKK